RGPGLPADARLGVAVGVARARLARGRHGRGRLRGRRLGRWAGAPGAFREEILVVVGQLPAQVGEAVGARVLEGGQDRPRVDARLGPRDALALGDAVDELVGREPLGGPGGLADRTGEGAREARGDRAALVPRDAL